MMMVVYEAFSKSDDNDIMELNAHVEDYTYQDSNCSRSNQTPGFEKSCSAHSRCMDLGRGANMTEAARNVRDHAHGHPLAVNCSDPDMKVVAKEATRRQVGRDLVDCGWATLTVQPVRRASREEAPPEERHPDIAAAVGLQRLESLLQPVL